MHSPSGSQEQTWDIENPCHTSYSTNRTWSLFGERLLCFSLSFICPPPICPDSSRFVTSVILTTTLWDGIIIMFTLQMGKLSPSSIKELVQGCIGRKRLSWGPKFGQWDLNLSSFHNTQCLSLLLWGWGEKVPWANISCPTPEITAMLGQVPGTCELGASCS